MARGVGALNVSVNADTAKANRNIGTFRSELGKLRRSADEFKGNTLGDYMSKISQSPASMRAAAQANHDLSVSVVDLRKQTSRYSDDVLSMGANVGKGVGALTTLNGAMKVVGIASKAMGFTGIVISLGQLGIELYRNENAWNEWGTTIGRWLNLIDEEGQRPDEILGKRLDAQNKQLQEDRKAKEQERRDRARDLELERQFAKEAARRERDVAIHGETEVAFRDNVKKFGSVTASIIQADLDAAATARAKLAADEEAAQKKREAAMKRELDHQENLKRDAEELGKLRDRVANFGKTELEIDRNRVLRELDDPRQRREALGHFNTLERLEQEKGRIDSLRKDRETLEGRREPGMLDARSAEGWAALRSSVNPQLQKMDRQIAIAEQTLQAVKDGKREEVFAF